MNEWVNKRPWLPYAAPLAMYFLFLQAQGSWPQLLEVWYPLKTVAVAATLWIFRRHYTELKLGFSWSAVLVGLVVIVIWIAIDPFYPKMGGGTPHDPTGNLFFIVFRIIGAVLVVPVMEELFWRAFLIRWLVNEDFKSVPVGTFTWFSFAATVVLFSLAHTQWLAGMFCGVLYNWLYYRRRDVFACVIAHAVSNAVLAAYVLVTKEWQFW